MKYLVQSLTFSREDSLIYLGQSDLLLVTMSVAIAVFASYAALLVTQHIANTSTQRKRMGWLAVGGLCMGLGIWAMHFVGMLAFSLPCATGYNTKITFFSVVPSLIACTLALYVFSRNVLSSKHIWGAGILLGSGIGAMHYTGMAAMQFDGFIRYEPWLVTASLVFGIGLATLAIAIKVRLQARSTRNKHFVLIICAFALGLAVSAVHYTAMLAAVFVRVPDMTALDTQMGPTFLATVVLIATGFIIVITLVATYLVRPNLKPLVHSYKVLTLLILGWCVIAWFAATRYSDERVVDLYQESLQSLRQQSDTTLGNINSNLQQLQSISVVLSAEQEVSQALKEAMHFSIPASGTPLEFEKRLAQSTRVAKLNQQLLLYSGQLNVDAIWVVNSSGNCIAASNANQLNSLVGASFSDRKYFMQAQAGKPGSQYAVGRSNEVPSFYYATPVMKGGRFFGAVIVKRNVSGYSQYLNQAQAFFTDSNSVIIATSYTKPEITTPLSAEYARFFNELQLRENEQSAFEPLRITPFGDARLPLAVRVGYSEKPVLLISSQLRDEMMTLNLAHPLIELETINVQRVGLSILLASTGSMLILAVYFILTYLRESRLSAADLRIAAVAFEAQEGMAITNKHGFIMRVNIAFLRISRFEPEDLIGSALSVIESDQHKPTFTEELWTELRRTGSWQGEVWSKRKTGEVYPSRLVLTDIKGSDGEISHVVAMHTDITVRKAAEQEIEMLAFYDQLTHLPNRRLLLDRLHQAVAARSRTGHQCALLFIDLDNFKTLNDTRGHDKGDLLLQQVALRLSKCIRAVDTVARLGGDEFVVMLEELSNNLQIAAIEAKAVGDKILIVLGQPYSIEDEIYCSTPSIGITLFEDHDDRVEEVLKRADLAMYEAKAAGRNTFRFFDPEMQAAVSLRATLEDDLREALQHHHFALYYQIQVGMQGRLIGAEALVRWLHPKRGLVSPAHFIPVAEDSGLIIPLGLWVLETACLQLVIWSKTDATADLNLAVNVSVRQFSNPDFVEQVLNILTKTGAPAYRLKLEITESLLLDDLDDIIKKMMKLKARGIGFSIDDFGTGYSSLSYLKRLPLDQLKIDQSFIRDIFTDAKNTAIVKTIVTLAQSLGLEVIAEGVETLAQRDFLAEQGCYLYQGYLFGRPEPTLERYLPAA